MQPAGPASGIIKTTSNMRTRQRPMTTKGVRYEQPKHMLLDEGSEDEQLAIKQLDESSDESSMSDEDSLDYGANQFKQLKDVEVYDDLEETPRSQKVRDAVADMSVKGSNLGRTNSTRKLYGSNFYKRGLERN